MAKRSNNAVYNTEKEIAFLLNLGGHYEFARSERGKTDYSDLPKKDMLRQYLEVCKDREDFNDVNMKLARYVALALIDGTDWEMAVKMNGIDVDKVKELAYQAIT